MRTKEIANAKVQDMRHAQPSLYVLRASPWAR
jgi:hypothetical protein